MSDIVPRSEVSRQGVKGIGSLAGGAALLILSSLHPIGGFIIGGVLALAGFALWGSKADRNVGIVAAGAGIVTIASKIIPGLGWLMWIPGVVLLGTGIYYLVRFFANLRKRS